MAKKYHGGKNVGSGKVGMYDQDGMKMGGDFANLPQDVKFKAYPKQSYADMGRYRDSQEGIDDFGRKNAMGVSKQKLN